MTWYLSFWRDFPGRLELLDYTRGRDPEALRRLARRELAKVKQAFPGIAVIAQLRHPNCTIEIIA